ncbi:MAG TPA: TlpA family protein disulfide reductase [Gammaproteobacteria bacterium]|nr:TlpA family protein disulfide reductase [Gammaproteobacteria bacterium]
MLRRLRYRIGFLLALLLVSNGVMALTLTTRSLPYAAPDVSFQSQGKTHSLKEYRGHKVLLWMFSTWCHTCVAGVKALEKQQAALEKQGLLILSIRNHNNGGYPGPDMTNFMKKFGPYTLTSNNWVLGESSTEMYRQLNPTRFPDIYFLIDELGQIQVVDTAPNLTMNKIVNFANSASK